MAYAFSSPQTTEETSVPYPDVGLSRRQFTKDFKLAGIQRLERGVSIGEVARALEVSPNVLHRWRRQAPGNSFPGNGNRRWSEGRIAELERKIGQQALDWKSAVYRKVEEDVKADRGLTLERMTELGTVSRSSFYRFVTRSSALRWSGPAMAGHESRPNSGGAAGG